MNGEGWYLVKDTFTKAGETTVTSGTPAVVATTVNGLSNLRIAADATTGQGNITTEGQFNAKNANPTDEPLAGMRTPLPLPIPRPKVCGLRKRVTSRSSSEIILL